MTTLDSVKKSLKQLSRPERAKNSSRFFKSGKGEYGEGDVFLGIRVPEQRAVAKQFYKDLSLPDVKKLLSGKFHEERFTALEILVMKYDLAAKQKDKIAQSQIVELYLGSTHHVNNWDLVDTSAPYILGPYLEDKPRSVLKKLAKSKNLWERRIAMVACFYFIKREDFADAFVIAELLLKDTHDLIHKAVGWMLKEIGNHDRNIEKLFLDKHWHKMHRTMLRYAIEKFPDKERKYYLGLKK